MKNLTLTFKLRNEFVELKDLFLIFNNMLLTNKVSSTDIEVKKYWERDSLCFYLYIGLHCCKTSFASIEISRDIDPVSTKTSDNLYRLSKLKRSYANYVPFFSVAEDNKTVTIVIFDIYSPEKKETYTNIDDIMNTHTNRLLSLDFYLRKPFTELPALFSIANRMLAMEASSFITLRPSVDSKKTYLNINFLYEDISRPSLSITVGLIGNSVPNQYQFELAKYNFACSQIPNVSPVFISCNDTHDSKHGPMIRISVFKSTNSDVTNEIEKQFKLLDTISPM